MNNTVTACVDGSLSTRSVCEYAAWAARTLQSQLALLHVIEKDSTPGSVRPDRHSRHRQSAIADR